MKPYFDLTKVAFHGLMHQYFTKFYTFEF